ncbi:MAG: arylsulfatase [Prosthecobacter sp.]|uniref:arylsulfatase n=1 Tax=Prosthecobacter sp. TaxID=1965333 RepID=UPI0038FFA4D4
MKHLIILLALTLTAHARQPNIIFILADDLGPGDLGCYGQKIIRTPNIDRIAAEGMRFTQHYSGNAVCAPSRCVLMSGLHPGHAFIRDNRSIKPEGQWPIPNETVIIPEVLKPLGYTSGGFGKWGLGGPGTTGEPLKQGFDRWFGYNCQAVAHNFYPTYLWDNDQKIDLKNPAFPSNDKFKPGEDPTKPESYQRFKGTEYSADLIAEQALKFARDNKAKPFFLYWPTTVPHVALQVPDDSLQEYLGKFEDAPYPGGKGYLPHFAPRAAYAAMITRMDREIGKMMALIAELGLDDDTIFVFTSDNGPLNGTHAGLAGTDAAFFNSAEGRRDGKGTLYEGGFRTPCVVRWTGKIKAGAVSNRVSGFEDWLPTLLDLAGAKGQTPNTDGISLVPTLLGETQPEREFLYREFPSYGGQQMLRMGDWKLVRRNLTAKGKAKAKNATTTEELFNIATDPAETKNVAAEHPDLIAKMKTIMASQHTRSTDFPMAVLDQ